MATTSPPRLSVDLADQRACARWLPALLVAVMLALSVPGNARADAERCSDPMLSVQGAEADLATWICEAAMAAKAHLAQCGLVQQDAVEIALRTDIDGPAEHCAGLYTCGSDRIILLSPSRTAEIMPHASIFAPLPPKAYYRSLIVHELAHALMDQVDATGQHGDADREYVAYALQIGSLSPEHITRVEAFRQIDRPVDPARLNDFLLFMKPDIFATHAWAHFNDAGNGCAFVSDLLSARRSLKLPMLDQ